MDQIKIGKLISECRKQKNMTQEQLAEKLGVTNKAISKWENGKCLPDVSLWKEIVYLLEITINELLAGEKIPETLSKIKAEECIINLAERNDLKTNQFGIKALSTVCIIMVIHKIIKGLPFNDILLLYIETMFCMTIYQ